MAAGNAVAAPEHADACPAAAVPLASTLAQLLSMSARCSSIVSPVPSPLHPSNNSALTISYFVLRESLVVKQ